MKTLINSVTTVEDYIEFLTSKGFSFGEDALGFISFGQHYTSTTDEVVNVALEITLKAQKEFDGSFFVSLLEMFKEQKVSTRKSALELAQYRNII
ncbi:DUF6123 family protein [Bacillus sp. PS06]|uniref:DUF6123 family protein n=1 Tax=Bacillus sp. PS06 TaxID=2764176 RepID=UPI001781F306|nr:DUF6123 family protein [Bacillus sp. PS06]MBD8068150.1 hypothetical protein [Bacillus sp. PS06]